MYSDMSKRTRLRSLPKRKAARPRATSVLPTPVGPRKRNEPTGRFGFLSPARVRRMALATALIAPSCDTIRRCSSSSMRSSFSDSSSLREVIGIPVQRETTSSMSAFVTGCRASDPSVHCSLSTLTLSRPPAPSSRKKPPPCSPASGSSTTRSRPWASGTSAGTAASRSFTRLPASSMRSIALSGRKRSVMYRLDW